MKTNYTKELNTFLFLRAWGTVFLNLPDEDAGKIIKALYRYINGEDPKHEEFDNPALYPYYGMMRNMINRSSRLYFENIKRRNAESADQSSVNGADAAESSPEQQKEAPNHSESPP